jgi:hypothetical protein
MAGSYIVRGRVYIDAYMARHVNPWWLVSTAREVLTAVNTNLVVFSAAAERCQRGLRGFMGRQKGPEKASFIFGIQTVKLVSAFFGGPFAAVEQLRPKPRLCFLQKMC